MIVKPIVTLEKAHFAYDESPSSIVLESFDLQVGPRDRISIYGPNGCGKSTVLYVLADLLHLDSGTRTIDGSARQSSFVFQDYSRSLLNWYTVEENLQLASDNRSEGITPILEGIVGGDLPTWLSRALEKFPYELSGGQRQLICLLRGLISRPGILYLDEPFSGLDLPHKKAAMRYMENVADKWGSAWVVVSHNLDDCFLVADTVIVVEGPALTVLARVDVPGGWPRNVDVLSAPGTTQARKQVYEVLWERKKNI